ncbi:MAG: hypothetical protein Q7U35_04555 [Methanobacteriaceae archaeon]|nr:hypothetical protein [Methanobacteriaceae archaeon]
MIKSENAPDRLFIEKDDREIYDRLKKINLFRKYDNKNLFLMAMVFGFHKKQFYPINNPDGFVRLSYLRDNEESLINALAVYEINDLDILLNKKKVYLIAEEYANAGIKIIDKMISDSDEEFIEQLEYLLLEKYEDMDIDEKI